MLIVRKEQMEALDAHMLESFYRRLVAHVREVFPAETAELDAAALTQRARAEVGRAKTFGVIAERDAARFVDVSIALGDGWPELGWAAAILQDRDRSGSAKMDEIVGALPERAPKAARLAHLWGVPA